MRARLAWPLCGIALASACAAGVLDVLDRTKIHSLDEAQPAGIVLGVSFSLLGAVVVARRPGNRIAWIYLLIGVLMPLPALAALYYARSVIVDGLPGARWAAWFYNWSYALVFPTGLALFAFLLFPTGRLPSRRSIWLARGAVATAAAQAALTCLDPTPISVSPDLPSVTSPTGVAGLAHTLSTPSTVIYTLGLVLIALAIATLVRRGRHTSSIEERRQVKAVAYAAALTIGAILALTLLVFAGVPLADHLWDVPIVFGFGVAVATAFGVAIVKHGLYDIDRLISRTVSYAIVTATVAGVFLGIVVLTTDVLPFSSPVGVAASTLAAAAVFNPLRRRVQHVVARRFNRARYDAEQMVAAFSRRLRDAVELELVQSDLMRIVDKAVAPAHSSVWLRRE